VVRSAADFEAALKLNPNDDGALYGLSQSLREARDYGGAQRALSELIARSPNFVYWLEWVESVNPILVGATLDRRWVGAKRPVYESKDGSKWLKRRSAKVRLFGRHE
jgi:tetratricopeptide (TPR) repeat protein